MAFRILTKDWEASYASLSEMVVPGSAKRVTEDQEHALYTVTLFKKVIEEYKTNCRERK
jgi:V-type H+-transporting ATPase subunit C